MWGSGVKGWSTRSEIVLPLGQPILGRDYLLAQAASGSKFRILEEGENFKQFG